MPGHGPPPKHQKQGRSQAKHDWIVLPAEPLGTLPDMPEGPKGGWSNQAVKEWTRWWDSPAAHMWDDSDCGLVDILLSMTEEYWTQPNAALATQIRLLKNDLGLSPEGRRHHGWLLPEEADEAEEKSKQRSRAGSDPRK